MPLTLVASSRGAREGEQIAQIEALLEHSRKMLDDADRLLALLEAEQAAFGQWRGLDSIWRKP